MEGFPWLVRCQGIDVVHLLHETQCEKDELTVCSQDACFGNFETGSGGESAAIRWERVSHLMQCLIRDLNEVT